MRLPRAFRDPVLWLLAASALTLAIALWNPTASWRGQVRSFLAVVDVTQSMNARDYIHRNRPEDRLSHVRRLLRSLAGTLPCGTRVGLGAFSGWNTEILFEPVEVCRHRREIRQAVSNLHWRIGWVPQSNVLRGINNAREGIAGLSSPSALVFFTDGDEAPPRWQEEVSVPEDAAVQRVPGLLVGVGSPAGSPVPRYNRQGEVAGYFMAEGKRYRSALAADHLRRIAEKTKLGYARLKGGEKLASRLESRRFLHAGTIERSLGRPFAWAGLILLLAAYVAELLPWGRSPSRERDE